MAIYEKIINVCFPLRNNVPVLFQRNDFLNHQIYATYKLRALEKQLGIPAKPKRPLTPFFKFAATERPKLLTQYPKTSMMDMMKKLAEYWQTFDNNEKEKMKNEFKKEMEQYTKDVITYNRNLSEDQKNALKLSRAQHVENDKKHKMKLKMRLLGRPKKPPTAFVYYMISKMSTRSKDCDFSEWVSIIAKEWSAMSEESKSQYRDETRKLMEQYKKELILWEDNMIKLGHLNLIRKQVLVDLKGDGSTNDDKPSS